jgi:hypothetical protein
MSQRILRGGAVYRRAAVEVFYDAFYNGSQAMLTCL